MQGYDLPTFPYRRAPEQETGQPVRHRVAIIGGGLTGLTLACDLALRGIASVVLDEDDTIGVRGIASRGICYERRTLDIFERLGITQRMLELGKTWSVGRVLSGDDELYNFDLQMDPAVRNPPFVNIQQYYVEWFLVDRITELGVGEIRWKNEVTGLEQREDHVRLTVETPDGPYTVEADWVVAADGVGSNTRQGMGIEAHQRKNNDFWCITDVRLRQDVPVERHTWVDAPFNNGKACWKHMMADDVWRLDFQLGKCDIKVEASPEKARARAEAVFGEGFDFEVVSVVPWEYYYQLIDDFRVGRVIFAGDSAHAFSSFGGRGGNSGVQDAENLAWKLAAFLKGEADEALLDTYNEERRPAAAYNILVTERSSRFMAPEDVHEHRLRRAILNLARRHAFARVLVNTGRLSDPYVYDASGLTTSGGEAVADRQVGGGSLFARFRDLGGFRGLWAVPAGEAVAVRAQAAALAELAAGSPPVETMALGGAAGDGAGDLLRQADPDGSLAAAFDLAPGGYVLLRPDSHVAARFDSAEAGDIAAARDRAMARQPAAGQGAQVAA